MLERNILQHIEKDLFKWKVIIIYYLKILISGETMLEMK